MYEMEDLKNKNRREKKMNVSVQSTRILLAISVVSILALIIGGLIWILEKNRSNYLEESMDLIKEAFLNIQSNSSDPSKAIKYTDVDGEKCKCILLMANTAGNG